MTQPPQTICQLLHGLGIGGAEVLAARMGRQLCGAYRFVFVCLDELGHLGRQLRDEGFPVRVLDRKPGVDWSCARRLGVLLRQERVDLLHAHQYTPFFYGLMARLFSGTLPVLFTEHGRWFPDRPRPRRIVANRLLLRRRDRVIGVGQTVRQALIRNEKIPAGRVEVIYNGIDLGAFSPGACDCAGVRREMGVGPDDLVIVQVARLDALKDHATALRALERVVRHRGNARLVLVGEGPEEPLIRELVAARGLEANVRLLGSRSDVPRLLRASDLFLLTSVSEGIPLTVIEAMAAERPVVATRVGGVGEVVDEGRTGLLAPSGDDARLAEGILRLAADPAEARAMGQRGRARALTHFSEETMLGKYDQLYREMLRA